MRVNASPLGAGASGGRGCLRRAWVPPACVGASGGRRASGDQHHWDLSKFTAHPDSGASAVDLPHNCVAKSCNTQSIAAICAPCSATNQLAAGRTLNFRGPIFEKRCWIPKTLIRMGVCVFSVFQGFFEAPKSSGAAFRQCAIRVLREQALRVCSHGTRIRIAHGKEEHKYRANTRNKVFEDSKETFYKKFLWRGSGRSPEENGAPKTKKRTKKDTQEVKNG